MKNDELEKLLKLNVDDISPDPMTAAEKEQLKQAVLNYEPKKKQKKKKHIPLWSITTLAALLLFSVLGIRFSSTIAMAAYQVPFLEPFVKLIATDRGMKDIIEQQYVEHVVASAEKDGLKVTIQDVIADESGIMLYFESNQDNVSLQSVKTKDGDVAFTIIGESLSSEHSRQFVSSAIVELGTSVSLRNRPLVATFTSSKGEVDVPFTLKKEIHETKWYGINESIVVDHQKIFIDKVGISPLRATVRLRVDDQNSKQVLGIENLALVDENGDKWGTIENGLVSQGNIEDQITYALQSNYFHTPEHLTLEIGRIQAVPKEETAVVVDFSKEKVLKQPSYMKETLRVRSNGSVTYTTKDGKNGAMINYFMDAFDEDGKTLAIPRMRGEGNGYTTKQHFTVDYDENKPIVTLPVRSAPLYLQGSGKISLY